MNIYSLSSFVMKKIFSCFLVSILLISTSFAYNPSQNDEKALDVVYEKLDEIYQQNPDRIEKLDAALPEIQKKYRFKKRLSYLLEEIALYVDTLLEESTSDELEDILMLDDGENHNSEEEDYEDENENEEREIEYQTDIEIWDEDDNTYFVVEDETLLMNWVINEETPNLVYEIFEDHDIEEIVMQEVPGSADDDANLEIALWLSQQELTIILEEDSDIASGGTDLFLAGAERIMYDGAKIGIHSWASDDGTVATDFPEGHKEHQKYIDYYIDLGFSEEWSEEFYYLTIESAPADDMYYMTNDEIEEYEMVTEDIRN